MGKRRVGAAKPKRSKEADKWIYTGSQYERWQKLKMKIGVTSDLHLLSMLLDSYIKSHVPDFYFPHTIPVTSPYVAATSTYTTETVTETVQGTDTSPGNIEIKMECDSDYDIATEETADTFDNSPEHREAITDHHSDKQYSVNTDNTKQPKKRVRIYIEKIVVETNKDNEDGGDDIPADANDCDEESNPDIPDIPDIHQASDEQSANVQESNNVSPKVQESNRESLATKDVHADSVDTSVRLDSDKVIKQETEDNGEYNTANAGPPSGQEKVMGSNSQEELRYLDDVAAAMLQIKITPPRKKVKRKNYSPTALMNAYRAVVEDGLSTFGAAKQFQIPVTTLRDRIDKRVALDCTKSGPEPVLSKLEEAKIVAHIKELALVGYTYTRKEISIIATDYAVHLGKKGKDKSFSLQWFYNFIKRWPDLQVAKPMCIKDIKARCTWPESIKNYFKQLEDIFTKYNLKDSPHLIYNVEEQVIKSGKYTVTMIGAGNAAGSHIPPFLIFPGKSIVPGLMEGKSVGANGTMTPAGLSNSEVFSTYIKNHFLQKVESRNSSEPILALYDGHKSHVGIDLIDWAKDNNIILFVLPPYCSHVSQLMRNWCFGPFQEKYDEECVKFTRRHNRTVDLNEICALACRAYSAVLSAANLQSSFASAGIYPLKSEEEVLESLKNKVIPELGFANIALTKA